MIPLTLLPDEGGSRIKRDRLELLTALMDAPGFDSLYRADIINIPRNHPVFGWQCSVADCDCVSVRNGFCGGHNRLWMKAKSNTTRAAFLHDAKPIAPTTGIDPGTCRICPERPAKTRHYRLCDRHHDRWRKHRHLSAIESNFHQWLENEEPYPGFSRCLVSACPHLACSPLRLCHAHLDRYKRDKCPGKAGLPTNWQRLAVAEHATIPVSYDDEVVFRRWCATTPPARRSGVVNLAALHPLLRAELQWGMHAHAQMRSRTDWHSTSIQLLAEFCRLHRVASLLDLSRGGEPDSGEQWGNSRLRMIAGEIADNLRCVYYSPRDTKESGFIETDHFGRRFKQARSHFGLTGISQRWLRDLLWEHLAKILSSVRCPRSRGPFDNYRRGCVELSAFLEQDAHGGGHDPHVLKVEHAQRFVADQRHRARHVMPSLALSRNDGEPSVLSEVMLKSIFNSLRRVLYGALESGEAARIGLSGEFITALPHAGPAVKRSRSPFSDEVARALADETNLQRLAQQFDPRDRGVRDIWEGIVYTGRRCGEVIGLKLDCIGRYGSLPMLWHDQTKVGNYDEAIRIPETLYLRLDERRRKTLIRFEHRHGRQPTRDERTAIALFPSNTRNTYEDLPVSYTFFSRSFRQWVELLDLGAAVPHQARHTLATNLLRAGASLAHIRRYLGQVSDRMAEHYAKVAHSDLEDVLHAVWVTGPGAPRPGEMLTESAEPLTREGALALALDLSRRSTPADGGFCTFQPVVNGAACPWNLDCENCDKFVLSGADLLYWRRKQEQWRSIAERAPDDATADYLHQAFEPTAKAIAGLEKALAGLGLLDQALALDLRRPQDYFHRVWSTAFRAIDLADIADAELDTTQEQIA